MKKKSASAEPQKLNEPAKGKSTAVMLRELQERIEQVPPGKHDDNAKACVEACNEKLRQAIAADQFVETIRQAIRESRLSHYAIGKQAEIAPAQIDRFMAGNRDLRLSTVAKICAVLGLTLQPDKARK